MVTGGTGSIGREIVKRLLDFEVEKVIVFSRDEIKQFQMQNLILDDRLETVLGDIKELRSLQRVFQNFEIDIIYHAAAMKHVVMCEKAPIEAVNTNIYGTQNVIDLAIEYDIPKVITISTDKAVHPVNTMGATKFIAEKITLNGNNVSENAFSCVRFGNVANSRGSVIPTYIDNLLNNKPIIVSEPNVTRFIMRIPDAVELILKASKYTKGGEIFIPKMKAFKLGDLVEVVIERVAKRIGIQREKIKIKKIGLVTGEKLFEELVNSTELRRLYELDDMYVVIYKTEKISQYSKIRKIDIQRYSSKDAELISKNELEKIVLEHLHERLANERFDHSKRSKSGKER